MIDNLAISQLPYLHVNLLLLLLSHLLQLLSDVEDTNLLLAGCGPDCAGGDRDWWRLARRGSGDQFSQTLHQLQWTICLPIAR